MYDGSPVYQKFRKFTQDITAYIDGYQIPEERQAVIVSQFLSRRAESCYQATCSEAPWEWSLGEVLEEIFNYCFPVDFRQRMREKLELAEQGGRTVREFVHELQELFLLLGRMSEETKVEKLWYGLRPALQADLFRARLTPASASWASVQTEAEIAELAQAAMASAERRQHSQRASRAFGQSSRSPRHDGGDYPASRSRDRPRDRRPEREPPTRPTVSTAPNSGRESKGGRTSGSKLGLRTADKHRNPLTDKERDDLRAAGKCYNCREVGHLSRNCPRSNQVSNSTRGKPPGVTAYSMNIASADPTDELLIASLKYPGSLPSLQTIRVTSELSDVGDEQQVDVLRYPLDPQSASSESFTDFLMRVCSSSEYSEGDLEVVPTRADRLLPLTSQEGRAYVPLGDVLADRAESLLNRYLPYFPDETSGDSAILVGPRDDDHVSVLYSEFRGITDNGCLLPTEDGTVPLSRACLEDETFDVVAWFRALLGGLLRRDTDENNELVDNGSELIGDAFGIHAAAVLNREIPWPGSSHLSEDVEGVARFTAFRYGDVVLLEDAYLSMDCQISLSFLRNALFDLPGWYSALARRYCAPEGVSDSLALGLALLDPGAGACDAEPLEGVSCCVADLTVRPLQRNAAETKDFRRVVPDPIVVTVHVNGQPARALLDSGSLADFMSAKFAHQLNVKGHELEKPLPVQLAVQGSRAKVNYGCKADIVYQTIRERRYFDIMNILNYDLILGTPFLAQHQMGLGFNPSKVVVGSAVTAPVPIARARIIESRAADVLEGELDRIRAALRAYAAPICRDASDAPFPPLRAVNHTIPLKDPAKVYHWRPSKCADALLPHWVEKRDAYLTTGRWRMSTSRNTSPMLLLKKPG
ncbi:uncharacterized protein TRAVEDRAFT_108852, partial [Trametes versicolor FP-101664 SS1]|uniref:uncharacterized protein n=1 Tax=Trametes versicolor (strain FP-101664) TaxID=717944 RepID=UPI0004621F2A